MKFSTKNPDKADIEFSVEIDEDGDFMVRANGHRLLFIEEDSGTLQLMTVSKDARSELADLKFDGGSKIKVA